MTGTCDYRYGFDGRCNLPLDATGRCEAGHHPLDDFPPVTESHDDEEKT